MDLRALPEGLNAQKRCDERRCRVEGETGADLSLLQTDAAHIGQADEKNCEQMIGTVPLPVGIAGPLTLTFSSGERASVYLPLATTEGALVASVNRGCKALTASGGVSTQSTYHGMSRSIVLKPKNGFHSATSLPPWGERPSEGGAGSGKHEKEYSLTHAIRSREDEWKLIGEATSHHLKILRYDLDEAEEYVFLTIFCDTSEAMGMNMVTIAAQAIGNWLSEELDMDLITVAANVDSDKKPSQRTHDRGRGYEAVARAEVPSSVIADVLKTTPDKLLAVADAKLRVGSQLAGAIGSNLHAANIVAALYLATGQDAAHVVEGSLADTSVSPTSNGIEIRTRLPALLVGIRGGGTALPAQNQCLSLILKPKTSLRSPQQLAETIGAAVLAGELSLLAAQATQTLASSHKKLAR
jgi:hydroxymethylglutaryl-CoA reductase (NADPH)